MTKCLSLSWNGHVMTAKRTKTRGTAVKVGVVGEGSTGRQLGSMCNAPATLQGPDLQRGRRGDHLGLGLPLLPATFQGRPPSRH